MSKTFVITQQEFCTLINDVSKLLFLDDSVLGKCSYTKDDCDGDDILMDDEKLLRTVYELIISNDIEDKIAPNTMGYLHSMFFSSSKQIREGFFSTYLNKVY